MLLKKNYRLIGANKTILNCSVERATQFAQKNNCFSFKEMKHSTKLIKQKENEEINFFRDDAPNSDGIMRT